jgi:hypothetical protein
MAFVLSAPPAAADAMSMRMEMPLSVESKARSAPTQYTLSAMLASFRRRVPWKGLTISHGVWLGMWKKPLTPTSLIWMSKKMEMHRRRMNMNVTSFSSCWGVRLRP